MTSKAWTHDVAEREQAVVEYEYRGEWQKFVIDVTRVNQQVGLLRADGPEAMHDQLGEVHVHADGTVLVAFDTFLSGEPDPWSVLLGRNARIRPLDTPEALQ